MNSEHKVLSAKDYPSFLASLRREAQEERELISTGPHPDLEQVGVVAKVGRGRKVEYRVRSYSDLTPAQLAELAEDQNLNGYKLAGLVKDNENKYQAILKK